MRMFLVLALATSLSAVGLSSAAAQGSPPAGTADGGPCEAQLAAHDTLRLRVQATLIALEHLREFRQALDQAYNAAREQEYWNATVDLASIAAGWPLGNELHEYFKVKMAKDLKEKLIKAGFKSVNKALLKDPTLEGVTEQITKLPTELSGAVYDQAKESLKTGLKKKFADAADPLIGFLDLAVLGKKVYTGMTRLEAIRSLLRNAQDQTLLMQGRYALEVAMLDHAVNAEQLCFQGVPHKDNSRWQEVRSFLNLPEAEGGPGHVPPGPTAREEYFGFILEGIGLARPSER